MSGPRRILKRGAGTPVPAAPPVVEVLPPTDAASFVAPPELAEIRARFREGEYRACVEPIEALFFARRNTFHQGLLQYVVALLQLRLGLVRTPRRLLRQALGFWTPYPDWQEGLDLAALRTHAVALLELLPEDVDKTATEEAPRWWISPPDL